MREKAAGGVVTDGGRFFFRGGGKVFLTAGLYLDCLRDICGKKV